MTQKRKYTFTKNKRPRTKVEVMARRFRHAKASLEIEGLKLSAEEVSVFEECIKKGCSIEERTNLLKERFPDYDNTIRA
tara:strand:+ start:12583 stop:12819 length:237 start_codon:yes stop_codon:yes gene_type:complete